MNRLLLTVLFALIITGCNTLNGVGKDIEKAGEAVQNTTK